MTSLAEKLKGLSVAKGLARKQLAERVPMERTYLYRIERGNDENVGRRILQGLAGALDVGVGYLADDSIDETRSWEKVAADESLELFFKKSNLTEEEKDRLRKISFRESAPRTLKGWEQTWDHIKVYSQPRRLSKSSKNRLKSHKGVNLGDSLTDLHGTDKNLA